MFFNSKPKYTVKRGYLHSLKRSTWLEEGELRLYPNGLIVYVNSNGFTYLTDSTTKPGHYLVADLESEFICKE